MAHFIKIILAVFILAAMGSERGPNIFNLRQEREAMAGKRVEEALVEHTPALMALPGVVGTAQGLCDKLPCIVIYVIQKTPELERKIPQTLEGFPVRIEETGEIRALPEK